MPVGKAVRTCGLSASCVLPGRMPLPAFKQLGTTGAEIETY